jgi:hypothetical protein
LLGSVIDTWFKAPQSRPDGGRFTLPAKLERFPRALDFPLHSFLLDQLREATESRVFLFFFLESTLVPAFIS